MSTATRLDNLSSQPLTMVEAAKVFDIDTSHNMPDFTTITEQAAVLRATAEAFTTIMGEERLTEIYIEEDKRIAGIYQNYVQSDFCGRINAVRSKMIYYNDESSVFAIWAMTINKSLNREVCQMIKAYSTTNGFKEPYTQIFEQLINREKSLMEDLEKETYETFNLKKDPKREVEILAGLERPDAFLHAIRNSLRSIANTQARQVAQVRNATKSVDDLLAEFGEDFAISSDNKTQKKKKKKKKNRNTQRRKHAGGGGERADSSSTKASSTPTISTKSLTSSSIAKQTKAAMRQIKLHTRVKRWNDAQPKHLNSFPEEGYHDLEEEVAHKIIDQHGPVGAEVLLGNTEWKRVYTLGLPSADDKRRYLELAKIIYRDGNEVEGWIHLSTYVRPSDGKEVTYHRDFKPFSARDFNILFGNNESIAEEDQTDEEDFEVVRISAFTTRILKNQEFVFTYLNHPRIESVEVHPMH